MTFEQSVEIAAPGWRPFRHNAGLLPSAGVGSVLWRSAELIGAAHSWDWGSGLLRSTVRSRDGDRVCDVLSASGRRGQDDSRAVADSVIRRGVAIR